MSVRDNPLCSMRQMRKGARSAGILAAVGRSKKAEASPSPLPPALVRYVQARRGDAALLAARCRLPDDVATVDDVPIVPDALDELLEAAADLLSDPFLALSLPGQLSFRRYGLHELVARASPTARDSLERVARYA